MSAFSRRSPPEESADWDDVCYRPLLSNLAVAKGFRRRGIARRLLAVAEQVASAVANRTARLFALFGFNPCLEKRGNRRLDVADCSAGQVAQDVLGCDEILLKVEPCNDAAMQLYAAQGYIHTQNAEIAEDKFVPLPGLAGGKSLGVGEGQAAAPGALPDALPATGGHSTDPAYGMETESLAPTAVPVAVPPAAVIHGQVGTWQPTTNICMRKDLAERARRRAPHDVRPPLL